MRWSQQRVPNTKLELLATAAAAAAAAVERERERERESYFSYTNCELLYEPRRKYTVLVGMSWWNDW